MNRLLKAAAALLCAFGLNSFANAQLTTVTASHIYMNGVLIPAGTVTFTPVSSNGTPIAFAQSGGGLNAPFAWSCTITTGAIAGGCQIPDSALTTPANILYQVTVLNTSTLKQFTLQAVPGITGTTWPLDAYGPPANTTNVQPIQLSYGTAAAPSPCLTPSLYIRNNSGGLLYMCVASVPVLVTGSGGSSFTIASTVNLIKGDGAGNGVSVASLNQCPPTAPQMTGIALTGNANCATYVPLAISGALADYDFLQGSGTTLTDISGNGNSGTLGSGANLPVWTSTGLSFTVNTQQVALPSALNGAETFLLGVYINPYTTAFPVTGNFPMLLGSSLGAPGLNMLYTAEITNNLLSGTAVYAPTIYANSLIQSGCQSLVSGFHVIGFVLGTGTGNKDVVYVDGQPCSTYDNHFFSAGLQGSGNLFLGASNVSPFTSSGLIGTYYRAAIFSGELTAAQVLADSGQMITEVGNRGVAVKPPSIPQAAPTIHCIGDSITFGLGVTTPFCAELTLTNQPTYVITNWGIDSAFIQGIEASEPNRVAPLCATQGGPANAIVFAGTNDLGFNSAPASRVMTYLSSEIQILKGAGCRVFVGTMISRAGLDTPKDTYDALILTTARTAGADGIVDFAASPNLGADGANSGTIGTIEACPGATTYFQSDCIHPTAAGHTLLATAASNSLNYYYGTTAAAPHIVTTTTYTMVSGDRFVEAAPTANAAYTMPDCTGPSGETYTINNPQSAHTLTIVGGTSQPINGLSSAITITSNSTVTLRDVANPKTISGCQWAM